MLTLSAMRVLVAVVEEGSFTRAAKRLNATQSGVSQAVAKLERALGVQLVVRASPRVVPTPAGRHLYDRCTAILRETSTAEAGLEPFASGLSGNVRAGMMPAITRALMGPVLRRFGAANPNVALKIVEAVSGTLIEQVRADELDLAIVPVFPAPDGIRCRLLGQTTECLVRRAGPDAGHRRPVDLAALGPLKLVLPSRENIRRRRIDAYLKSRGAEVSALIEMDSMFGTLEFVANSDHHTILPAIMMLPEIERGGLAIRPVDHSAFALEVMLIEPERRPRSPIVDVLARDFAEAMARPLRWEPA